MVCSATIPQSERDVLIALYMDTNGNGWLDNGNWCSGTCPLTGTPTFAAAGTECPIAGMANTGWYGITCDGSHVTKISLGFNYLSGTLPALTDLTNLQYVNFFNNTLSGSIPSLEGLTRLQILQVSDNQLT